ncbi:response regulator [Termitidicoccus mucosus]|uniref:Response regulatory domain-containing protein n=1 Tax=Termitidicoccus mucosus TaxID=1184151 RepID=A0A178IM15_9BACT|nr:hypothetical protein AW736_05485 [Opitutaceae bacterium TSB47]
MSSHLSILVVDDFRFNRVLLCGTLTQLGHSVVEAVDAETAYKYLAEVYFDIMFLDWELPGVRGDSVLNHIRHHHPALRVVAITADTSAKMKRHCLEAGVDGFLGKAFDAASVKSMIESVRIPLKRAGDDKSHGTAAPHPAMPSTTASIRMGMDARVGKPHHKVPPAGTQGSASVPLPPPFINETSATNPQAPGAHLTAIIQAALANYTSCFPGGVAEALRHCVEQFDNEWKCLVSAIRHGQRIEAIIAAHNLGSLAAILDVSAVRRAARKCENALRSGASLSDPLLQEPLAALSIVLKEIQRDLARDKSTM